MFDTYLKNRALLEKDLKRDLIHHYYHRLLEYFESYQKFIPYKQYRSCGSEKRINIDDHCVEVKEQDNQVVVYVTAYNKTTIFHNAETAFLHIVGKSI